MQEGHVAASKLFVSCGNAPEMFDACEEALDQIAVLVQMRILDPELLSVGTRRDDGLGTAGLDSRNQGIGVVALVGDDRIGSNVGDQIGGALDIGDLTCNQNQSQRVAQSIRCGVCQRSPKFPQLWSSKSPHPDGSTDSVGFFGADQVSLELVLKPVRITANIERNGVMQQTIQDGCGDHAVAKHLGPGGERLVAGEAIIAVLLSEMALDDRDSR